MTAFHPNLKLSWPRDLQREEEVRNQTRWSVRLYCIAMRSITELRVWCMVCVAMTRHVNYSRPGDVVCLVEDSRLWSAECWQAPRYIHVERPYYFAGNDTLSWTQNDRSDAQNELCPLRVNQSRYNVSVRRQNIRNL
jgi:hypothetical protein